MEIFNGHDRKPLSPADPRVAKFPEWLRRRAWQTNQRPGVLELEGGFGSLHFGSVDAVLEHTDGGILLELTPEGGGQKFCVNLTNVADCRDRDDPAANS